MVSFKDATPENDSLDNRNERVRQGGNSPLNGFAALLLANFSLPTLSSEPEPSSSDPLSVLSGNQLADPLLNGGANPKQFEIDGLTFSITDSDKDEPALVELKAPGPLVEAIKEWGEKRSHDLGLLVQASEDASRLHLREALGYDKAPQNGIATLANLHSEITELAKTLDLKDLNVIYVKKEKPKKGEPENPNASLEPDLKFKYNYATRKIDVTVTDKDTAYALDRLIDGRNTKATLDELRELDRLRALVRGVHPDGDIAAALICKNLDTDRAADPLLGFLAENKGTDKDEKDLGKNLYEALREAGKDRLFIYDYVLGDWVQKLAPDGVAQMSQEQQKQNLDQACSTVFRYHQFIDLIAQAMVYPSTQRLGSVIAQADYSEGQASGLFSPRDYVDALIIATEGDISTILAVAGKVISDNPMPMELTEGTLIDSDYNINPTQSSYDPVGKGWNKIFDQKEGLAKSKLFAGLPNDFLAKGRELMGYSPGHYVEYSKILTKYREMGGTRSDTIKKTARDLLWARVVAQDQRRK